MTGERFSSDEGYTSDDIPIQSGDEEEDPACCNWVYMLFLGTVLLILILVFFWGLIILGEYVLIPIENWAEGNGLALLIIVEISLGIILGLCFLCISYIVGIINRFGIKHISGTDMPTNRKWSISHGFILTMVGWFVLNTFYRLSEMIVRPESYWLAILAEALSNAIFWSGFVIIGLVGYLVATKSPFFKDTNE